MMACPGMTSDSGPELPDADIEPEAGPKGQGWPECVGLLSTGPSCEGQEGREKQAAATVGESGVEV